ncbi:hypothetical protein [Nocardia sp. NPDC050175]|uniref:hypothetical protein n=1 Tax=Nocardia sp. NPDC050175 TaxID=3364317 RepID=UPI0037B1B7AC
MPVLRSTLFAAACVAMFLPGTGVALAQDRALEPEPGIHAARAETPTQALIAQAQARADSAAARAHAAAGIANAAAAAAHTDVPTEVGDANANAAEAATNAHAATTKTTTDATALAADAADNATTVVDVAIEDRADTDAVVTATAAAQETAERAAKAPNDVKLANDAAEAEENAVAASFKAFGAPKVTKIARVKAS